jgi:hypothetical protein
MRREKNNRLNVEREIIKGREQVRTDTHLRPRRRTLTVRRELEHLRLDRIRRLLILLALALPGMKSGWRLPVLFQRALRRWGVGSR